jgi:hypothetical protein
MTHKHIVGPAGSLHVDDGEPMIYMHCRIHVADFPLSPPSPRGGRGEGWGGEQRSPRLPPDSASSYPESSLTHSRALSPAF